MNLIATLSSSTPFSAASCRRLLGCALVTTALSCASTSAWSAPPSDQSIESLLAITNSEKLIDKTGTDMEKYILAGVQAGLNGRQPSAREQEFIDKVARESAAVIREEMNWAAMRPLMVKIYRDTFTQEEVDAQINFYRSPAGASVVAKMPAVMDASMVAMQQRMRSIMPKLQALSQKAQKEFAASVDRPSAQAPQKPAQPPTQ